MIAGGSIANLLVYGSVQATIPEGFLGRSLPVWAVIYSRTIWWAVWSFTEELTYQGYALPRLHSLLHNRWIAILLVGLAWAVQHSFLPFVFDLKWFLYMFFAFFPLTIVMQLIYQRIGRLFPMVIAHWGMDFFATFYTL